jgi:hypothetical protein
MLNYFSFGFASDFRYPNIHYKKFFGMFMLLLLTTLAGARNLLQHFARKEQVWSMRKRFSLIWIYEQTFALLPPHLERMYKSLHNFNLRILRNILRVFAKKVFAIYLLFMLLNPFAATDTFHNGCEEILCNKNENFFHRHRYKLCCRSVEALNRVIKNK